MLPQQYCLRWKYHHSNLQTMFSQLLDRGSFCDVTLACEGQLIRAHRVVLCACSTFFDTVLSNYASERDPIIIIKDVTFADVRCLIEFMYKGEINVEHAHLPSLLKTADDLKIKGLAEVTWREDDDRPTPPTPAAEFYSPTREPVFPHDLQQRASPTPAYEARRSERRRSLTPPPLDARKLNTLPVLTPIPTSSSSASVTATPIEYLGPKRKRGRPPLDDAYDVFNIRKLAQYASQIEHQAYLEAHQFSEEQRQQASAPPSSLSPSSAAAVAYQHHIQQQQNKHRIRHRQKRVSSSEHEHDESLNPGPEWINSNLEVNMSEAAATAGNASEKSEQHTEIECKSNEMDKHSESDDETKKSENKRREKSIDRTERIEKSPKRKNSQQEQEPVKKSSTTQQQSATNKKHSEENIEKGQKQTVEHEKSHTVQSTVPQTVEDIENVKRAMERLPSIDSADNARSRQTSPAATHKSSSSGGGSGGGGIPLTSAIPLPPPLPHGGGHFGKYAPEGYLLNEHGMLMTHDSFVHAPMANIPVSSANSGAGGHDPDFVDIKMEDYDTADLRLTSEEMSQWQDVIKMDDYLAKGRRPQFWEEPFTRRVLDAIKNKRLEMKKAARILGVSYGTLYGRYREVYGCLKHPYSNSTGYRPSTSQLSVQPRFDMIWPPGKRDASALLAGPLDIGKLRPSDLTELWARPQL